MQKIIPLLLVSCIIACGNKEQGFDKDRERQACVVEATESGALDSIIERKDVYRVCDCMVKKAATTYKTGKEFHDDKEGFQNLLFSCLDMVRNELKQ